MRNKKGWIRIFEAVLAVLLIASVLVMFYVRSFETSKNSERVYNLEKAILEDIVLDNHYRQMILENNLVEVDNYIKIRVVKLLPGFNYSISICNPEDICPSPYYDREIYSSERIVSANLEQYSPKKLKIFIWRV